jgi:hypothetical protein
MGVGYNPRIVINGLQGYWDAGNARSYPGSGTTWTDLSGNGNNGTLTNGPTFASNGVVFDGVNDYVDCGTSSALNFGTGNYTIHVVFKTSNSSRRETICSRFDYDGTGTIERGYFIDVQSTGKIRTLFATNGPNEYYVDGSTSVNTNTFVHYTMCRTGTASISSYVNGVSETITPTNVGSVSNINTVTAPFSIGRRLDYQQAQASSYNFTGTIAFVSIYNRVLSAAEIRQNFYATRGRYGI